MEFSAKDNDIIKEEKLMRKAETVGYDEYAKKAIFLRIQPNNFISWNKNTALREICVITWIKNSRMDQVKFVEDSL